MKEEQINLEAEKATLGAMLLKKTAIEDVIKIIKDKKDFSESVHQETFQTIVELYNEGKEVSVTSVSEKLAEKNELKGNPFALILVFLNDLINSVAISENAKFYAEIVREKARKRLGQKKEV